MFSPSTAEGYIGAVRTEKQTLSTNNRDHTGRYVDTPSTTGENESLFLSKSESVTIFPSSYRPQENELALFQPAEDSTSLPVTGEIAGVNRASLGGSVHRSKSKARWAEGFHDEFKGHVFEPGEG